MTFRENTERILSTRTAKVLATGTGALVGVAALFTIAHLGPGEIGYVLQNLSTVTREPSVMINLAGLACLSTLAGEIGGLSGQLSRQFALSVVAPSSRRYDYYRKWN